MNTVEAPAATSAQTQVVIRPVSFAVIYSDPAAADLIRAYSAECLIPDAQPQTALYSAMEKAGALRCFAAYLDLDRDLDRHLIGFASILTAVMPHTGQLLATGESIFVDPTHRGTGAGDLLLAAAEDYADSLGATLSWLPRAGSAFDKVLSRRAGYTLTHAQHTRRQA